MKKKITWICVADAAHARILQSTGPGTPVESVHEAKYDLEGPKQYTDEPGRTRESADGSYHGLSYSSDPERQEKREMAHDLAEWLESSALDGRFDRLILVAPPKFLGDLRDHLADKVKERIIQEIPKDYTKIRDEEVRKRVAEVAPV